MRSKTSRYETPEAEPVSVLDTLCEPGGCQCPVKLDALQPDFRQPGERRLFTEARAVERSDPRIGIGFDETVPFLQSEIAAYVTRAKAEPVGLVKLAKSAFRPAYGIRGLLTAIDQKVAVEIELN